jgi:hypothetical protein
MWSFVPPNATASSHPEGAPAALLAVEIVLVELWMKLICRGGFLF